MLGVYRLDGVKSIQWGQQSEEYAIKKFEIVNQIKVEGSGLWLDVCEFLGASPDGLIGEDALVEVKCPYSYRNSYFKDTLTNKDVIYWQDDDFVVNTSHQYYHQI